VKTRLRKTLILAACLVIIFELTVLGMRHLRAYTLRANVVLILLDTVRADRLGCYGNSEGLTPNIDRFAEDSVRFEYAYSHAPWTLPSVASLYTSRHPMKHGAGGDINSFTILPDSAQTLAEILRDAGAKTAAVVNVSFLTKTFGLHQGFGTMNVGREVGNEVCRTADQTTDAALTWLSQNGKKRFFLVVHYFDPHLIYDPPKEYRMRFADAVDRDTEGTLFGSRQQMLAFRSGKLKLDEPLVRRLEKLHNAEIAFVDAQIGRLLSTLAEMKISDETVIVITSDHGEEFWDHGGFEHGHTLYHELLHVPLILHIPSGVDTRSIELKGKTVSLPFRHIDVAPTLCQLVGLETPDDFDGMAIDITSPDTEPTRPVLAQGNMWGPAGVSYQYDGHKVIQEASPGSTLLFDITDDPMETRDISQASPELTEKMVSLMNRLLDEQRHANAETDKALLTETEKERLRSLGYMK